MTRDPTFGSNGSVQIHPQFKTGDYTWQAQGALLIRPDGEIIVGIGALNYSPDFTVAFKPDFPAGSASVSGRFFNDLNGNRKQDPGEPGLAYWQAFADINNNGVFDAGEPSGFADGPGNYSIHGLKPGTYIIREVRQDGWTRTTPAGVWPLGYYKVTLKAGQTIAGENFGNSNPNLAKGSISGTYFNDINGDQLQDNGEPALAGWQAYVDMNDNGVFDSGEPIATADKNGHYTISGLVQGGYVVREIRKDGWSRTTPPGDWPLGFYPVALTPGQKATGKNFGNVHASAALASVTGKVINDTNGNGKLDAGETGQAGITVQLVHGSYGLLPLSVTTTAADGSFSFTNVEPGTYLLEAWDDSTGWSTENSYFTLLPAQVFHQNFFHPSK
jgi:uncharacterized protein (DUF2141 family)